MFKSLLMRANNLPSWGVAGWSVVVFGITALGVLLTRTGVDVLVFVGLCAVIFSIDRATGERLTARFGALAWGAVLVGFAGTAAWGLFAKSESADRFYQSAAQAGYRPLFYDSAPASQISKPAPIPGAAPVDTPPSEVSSPKSEPITDATAVATTAKATARAGERAGENQSAPAGIEAFWKSSSATSAPLLRLEAPEIALTGSSVTIRAFVTERGEPISGASVAFTANGKVVGTSATDRHGIASTVFITPVPNMYELRARIEGSSRFRDSSAAALLHVLPGRSRS
jgi:hypothetical protein